MWEPEVNGRDDTDRDKGQTERGNKQGKQTTCWSALEIQFGFYFSHFIHFIIDLHWSHIFGPGDLTKTLAEVRKTVPLPHWRGQRWAQATVKSASLEDTERTHKDHTERRQTHVGHVHQQRPEIKGVVQMGPWHLPVSLIGPLQGVMTSQPQLMS